MEFLSMVQLKLRKPLHARAKGSPDTERCWELLRLTSRSFVAVIEQLHPELRDGMMIFYLILRGLDTIEDDTGLDNAVKLPLLRSFRDVLKTNDWTFQDSSPSEKDRIVLQQFDVILRCYHRLQPEYQDIIADIAEEMGKGMAHYIDAEKQKNYEGVKTIKDYDEYCHYVAGIVGEGCTRMALVAGFAKGNFGGLYESMGLFLQKTNIIRDYKEDQDDGRSFWPKEVWSKYATTLAAFTKPENVQQGLYCISNLTLLSLSHVPDVLEYLANIGDQSYFQFCAIPQVMSIATLELVYQNPDVFERNVKIRKGLACKLILESTSMENVYRIFRSYVRRIHQRNDPKDPNYLDIELSCSTIERYINDHDKSSVEYKKKMSAYKREYDDIGAEIFVVGVLGLVAASSLMIFIAYLCGAPLISLGELKTEATRMFRFIATGNDTHANPAFLPK